MPKAINILKNKYLLYFILLSIIFTATKDFNLNILKYASIVTLIFYILISQYNIKMSKKEIEDSDLSNFYISGESLKTEYILITCIYLSAFYTALKVIILA